MQGIAASLETYSATGCALSPVISLPTALRSEHHRHHYHYFQHSGYASFDVSPHDGPAKRTAVVHVTKRDSDNPARIYTSPTTPFISSTATGWLWSNAIRAAYGARPTVTHFEQQVDDRPRKHAGCNNASTAPAGTLRCSSSHAIGTHNTGLTPRTLDPTTCSTTTATTTTTTHSLYVSTSLTLSGSGHCS